MKKLFFTLLACLAFVGVGKAQDFNFPEKYEIYSAYNEKTSNTAFFYIGYSYVGYFELTTMSTTTPEPIKLKIISSEHTMDGFPTTESKFKVQSPNGRQVWTIEPKYENEVFSLACTYPNGETQTFEHYMTLRAHMGSYKRKYPEKGIDETLYFYFAEDVKTLLGSYKNSKMPQAVALEQITFDDIGSDDGLPTRANFYNPHTQQKYNVEFTRSELSLEKRIYTKPSLVCYDYNGVGVEFLWVKK